MKYFLFINDELEKESEELCDIEDYVRDFVDTNMDENEYDEMLDESYEEVEMFNCTFTPSEILKNCDRVAYDMGMSDEINSVTEDLLYNLGCHYEANWSSYYFEIIELPTEIVINKEDLEIDIDTDLETAISDYLTITYDYCHNGFHWEESENNDNTIEVTDIEWDV